MAFAGGTLAFTGPTNPSFESGTYLDNGLGWEQLNAGDESIDGWKVDAGSVDWIGDLWTAPDGAMSIDLSGSDEGTLSQTFETTIGNTYTVSFLMSGNPSGGVPVKTLNVSATGGSPASYSHDTTGTDLTSMAWTAETYTFLATSAITTLSFISTTDGEFGPALDAVAVTESVPVKDDCKQGGWQSMIDDQGNSFKNQGDCVSYFATKGRNKGAVAPVAVAPTTTTTDAPTRSKHVAKTTTRHTTERHVTKVKAKSHGAQSHSAQSHGKGANKKSK
jgi:choice-of-anchor C domain-containing protein